GGGVANVYADSPVAEYIHQVVFRPLRRDPGPVRMVPSLNVSYKSACIDQVGFFDETIPQAGGEDVDHCWRVTAAGWEVRYQPDLVVSHHYPTTYRALVRQARMYGRGFCQSRHRQPDLPGSDFVSMPWWRAVAGTAPHVAREAIRTATEVDVAAVPASILREAMFRAAALAERKRLATP
ncbi:MAG: mycofactocin glycosyltransferase, partial [Acidimicrobiaceae bacterium]|nr:mycofactocin glycosyltransferase [Acidimicrobiaceae bacterium]